MNDFYRSEVRLIISNSFDNDEENIIPLPHKQIYLSFRKEMIQYLKNVCVSLIPQIDNQLEIFVSSLVYNSMINFILKEQKGQNNILNKNSIIPDKLEIQNFYLNEMTMISVLTGMKFNKNIVEINLSGNTLSPKSCFCLGSCFKTLPYLAVLDISKCDINNDKLYMLVEGTKFYSDENLNKEKFNLKKLNLKDNYDISIELIKKIKKLLRY